MAEYPFVGEELENDISKLRGVLGHGNQEDLSEDDSSIEDDYASDDDKCDDEAASGSSSGHILPESCYSSQNLESSAENSDNKLERCLALNRAYQQRIIEITDQLKEMLQKNKQKQETLMEEMNEPTDKEKTGNPKLNPKAYNFKSFGVFEAPYFRDINGQFAPPNEDTIIKNRNKEVTAYVVPHKSWSDLEKRNLKNAVALNAKELLLNPLLIRKDVLTDKLSNKELSEEEIATETARLEATNITIENIKNTPKEECIGPRGATLDWLKISATGLDGSRTAEECMMMWDNYYHISINKGEWTEAEDNALWNIAEKHNFFNWDSIAQKLQTNRTAWQCLRRYQQKLKRSHIRGSWSKSEDDLLRRVVEICRAGDYIPWHQVAYYFEGRTRTQIMNRWRRSISPDLRKGTWSLDEDLILLAAIKKHNQDWPKVSKYLPGRTNTQCRERYKNTLEDGITIAEWTADEDLKLLQLVKKYGEGKWAVIAQEMNGRLDNSIYQRFRLLKNKRPDILDCVDPEITPDVSILPATIMRPGQCSKAMKRRKDVYDAFKSRNINLESLKEKAVENAPIRSTDPLLGNGMLFLKCRPKLPRGHRKKKSQKDAAVDSDLDAFLAPLLSLPGPLIKSKCLSMTGIEWIQATTAKLFLFKLFKCDDGTIEEIGIPERCYSLFEETREVVDKVFKHLIVGRHCEDNDCVVPVIPPNRSTINGFKVVLSSRKRLILSAQRMKDLNIIPVLTSKSMDSVQCLDCMNKQDFLVKTEDDGNNEMSSNEPNKMPTDDSPPETSSPKKKRGSKGKYSKLIQKYSQPVESVEEIKDSVSITQKPCQTCDRTKVFHIDFQLLKMRFLATFLWPALLSTLIHNENDETQDEQYETADEESSPAKPKKSYHVRKRKQKKPWVTEILKRRHLELHHTLREAEPKKEPVKRGRKYNKAAKNQPPTRRSARCATKLATDN